MPEQDKSPIPKQSSSFIFAKSDRQPRESVHLFSSSLSPAIIPNLLLYGSRNTSLHLINSYFLDVSPTIFQSYQAALEHKKFRSIVDTLSAFTALAAVYLSITSNREQEKFRSS